MIKFVKSRINWKIKREVVNNISFIKSFLAFGNLTILAKIFKTDKWGKHFYTPIYQKHFRPFRFKKINFMEIGVGGYEDPYSGGHSLRMWKAYFPFARIYSLDIYNKKPQEERRIKIYKGSQVDFNFLKSICDEVGEFDLIVDDGSHINEHVIESFKFLFPKLKNGGIYVVEDTQTSYWSNYGGTSDDLSARGTIYHFFKALIDGLNYQEFMISDYEKTYYDCTIISMHFYHNMIFIYKGVNEEPSNYLFKNNIRNG